MVRSLMRSTHCSIAALYAGCKLNLGNLHILDAVAHRAGMTAYQDLGEYASRLVKSERFYG